MHGQTIKLNDEGFRQLSEAEASLSRIEAWRNIASSISEIFHPRRKFRELGNILAVIGLALLIGGIMFYFFSKNSALAFDISVPALFVYFIGLTVVVIASDENFFH